jgi:hypothetical protein
MAIPPIWQGDIFKLCKPAVFYPDKPVFMLIPLDGSSGCTANICSPEAAAIDRAKRYEADASAHRANRHGYA